MCDEPIAKLPESRQSQLCLRLLGTCILPSACETTAHSRGGGSEMLLLFTTSHNLSHHKSSSRQMHMDGELQAADRRCMLWFQTLSQKLGKDSILRLAVIENAPVTNSSRRRELNELPRPASSKENGDGWSRSSCFVIFQDNNNRLQQSLY